MGQKVLVTGASRGIGRATALMFADEGADLVVTARSESALSDVVAAIRAKGRKAIPLAWDLLDFSVVQSKLAEAKDKLGGLDVLVNNAGVVRLPTEHPDQTPEAAWDYVMDTNLKSLFFVSQAAASLMREQKHGVIINLASDAGLRGAPNAYCISKWGVIGFTKGLAQQFAPHGVRINGIAPGPVATGMMGCPDGQPKDSPSLPLGRFALPEEIASVAVFLASADSRAVFGHTIVVNTGNP
jgi:3-oxoacyl-[acyl-carrier protein] reductase